MFSVVAAVFFVAVVAAFVSIAVQVLVHFGVQYVALAVDAAAIAAAVAVAVVVPLFRQFGTGKFAAFAVVSVRLFLCVFGFLRVLLMLYLVFVGRCYCDCCYDGELLP